MNISDINCEIGSNIWFVNMSSGKISYLKVVEEITKKTLSGEEKIYSFSERSVKGLKTSIDISGEYFPNKEATLEFLLSKTTDSLKAIMLKAQGEQLTSEPREISKNSLIDANKKSPKRPLSINGNNDEYTLVEMPGGGMARVRVNL